MNGCRTRQSISWAGRLERHVPPQGFHLLSRQCGLLIKAACAKPVGPEVLSDLSGNEQRFLASIAAEKFAGIEAFDILTSHAISYELLALPAYSGQLQTATKGGIFSDVRRSDVTGISYFMFAAGTLADIETILRIYSGPDAARDRQLWSDGVKAAIALSHNLEFDFCRNEGAAARGIILMHVAGDLLNRLYTIEHFADLVDKVNIPVRGRALDNLANEVATAADRFVFDVVGAGFSGHTAAETAAVVEKTLDMVKELHPETAAQVVDGTAEVVGQLPKNVTGKVLSLLEALSDVFLPKKELVN